MGHNCIVFLPSKAISGAEKPESPKHDALTRFAVRVRLRFNADGVGRDAFLHPAYYGMNTSSVMQRQYLAPSDGLDVCVEMDIVGVIEGANKSSVISYSVDFLRHYQKLFEEFRDLPINLIEIGIAGGISLRLWEWYFSAARIVGMDINPACESLATSRVHIEIGSQIDKDLLTSICKRYPPTIFIDDGSHFAEHNIVTFEHAFPLLNPGGIYVVEDMFFHFGPKPERWQSGTHRSSADYFLDLARSLMARKHVPGSEQVPRAITAMVDTVTFIGGAAIIRKKYAVRDIGSAIKIGEQTIARIQKPGAGYYRLAEYIFQHNGPPEEIERACLAAMEGGNNSVRVRSHPGHGSMACRQA